MPKTELGKLTRLNATAAFQDEPNDFTPWLAEHLDCLSEELGLDLRPKAREHPVGRYSLDLLLEDSSGRTVIIENQFQRTDHTHLGQLLTYCAGTNAEIVIWIAEELNEEHVAALEWLNENTLPGIGFFGVKLEIVRIGNSEMVPHFRVLVQPNDWRKAKRAATQESVIHWTWEAYTDVLRVPPSKLEIVRRLAELTEDAIRELKLDWTTSFTKRYVSFQRSSGYNVVIIDFGGYRVPRLKIKLPRSLTELGEANPLPLLESEWDQPNLEQWWAIPSADLVTSVREVVELAARHQPATGGFR